MASSSSNQRSLAAKEKQPSARATLTSSSSSSSSSWNHSTAMQSKSVNGPPLQTSNRPKVPAKRSVTPNPRDHFNVDNDLIVKANSPKRSSSIHSSEPHDQEPGRVSVAVRLRPRHVEDADYADCVELQPEMKKLKLRKNNWSSESFKFDEVFSETASQKRVYQVVAKPVVESVLSGFNGTVMAYGQTGTGKTYIVGNLGKNDASERGIMVRALEDIMANISANDAVEVTYHQLYMESIHDLLSPNKVNIPIVEDSKTGEVSFPGAELVKVRDLDHFMELLQKAELNRHAANTKMNTNSSRSHAILMIYVRRPAIGAADIDFSSHELSKSVDGPGIAGVYTVRKSKLLIVDLAGSERIDKSGSEGQLLEEAKFINLSLTSLGKCINALAENSLHIPTRESKLTRILRDSFGGSARTSLIITIGPSERYHAETTSTIMFGQRAMKIVNMVKLKEEFDYESLSKKLEIQVDQLTREIDRQQKLRDNYINQMEKKLKECQLSFAEAERSLVTRSELHQLESTRYQNKLLDTTQPYEMRITELEKQLEDEHACHQRAKQDVESLRMLLSDQNSVQRKGEDEISKLREKLEENDQKKQNEINELQTKLAAIQQSTEITTNELESLREDYNNLSLEKEKVFGELDAVKQRLSIEVKHRAMLEDELKMLKVLPENVADVEDKKLHMRQHFSRGSSSFRTTMGLHRSISGQRVTIAEFCKEVGLEKIVSLLSSEDVELQMQAAKVVANLAAEDADQEKIVNEGGLDALLMLLQSSDSIPILRAASGAIANLAMNETNQGLIMSKGGAKVLTNTATRADDLPTLRMIAGAFANLCGNLKLHRVLQREGCIKALLGMAESGNTEIIAQVARGFANFAKSETRQVNQGHGKGPSLLIEADALIWLINNTDISSDSTRRHIELALCHLAQNEENARDLVSTGGLKTVIRMSSESSREDIRSLAKKTLKMNPIFQAQLREQR